MKASEPVNLPSGTSCSEQGFSEITERALARTGSNTSMSHKHLAYRSNLVTYCHTFLIMSRLRIRWYIKSHASNVHFFSNRQSCHRHKLLCFHFKFLRGRHGKTQAEESLQILHPLASSSLSALYNINIYSQFIATIWSRKEHAFE